MNIEFHRGEQTRPKGHALIYFRSSMNNDEVWATYVVILPITVDVSKYVPPFLMNQMGEIGPKDLSAFAFPPAPEQVSSYAAIEDMAEVRDDDILYAGSYSPTDVTSGMMQITEIVQAYADQYARIAGSSTIGGETNEEDSNEESEGLNINDVLYELMSDTDKLSELSKLIGRLRFAVDGSDSHLTNETESEIALIARHLPNSHNIPQLVEAVKSNDSRSAELAEVYLQRSYHLVHEEYAQLVAIESRIKDLEEGETSNS